MKTTKKGFTLIELIVVIAIIGVLAAILVPSMLGYVRKSKISSANSTAASIYKAINSGLTELDEEGVDIGATGVLSITAESHTCSFAATDLSSVANGSDGLGSKIQKFFNDIDRVKGDTYAYIEGGTCVALGVSTDATYTGTYPTGIINSDNYDDYKGANGAKAAVTAALAKLGYSVTIQ